MEFIHNNRILTNCQKIDFSSVRRGIFYIGPESDNQINIYVQYTQKKKDFFSLMRLKILFSYFIDFDLIEKLMRDIEIKKLSDAVVYNYISLNSSKHNDVHYNIYKNVFEDISIQFYTKYFNKDTNITYLDYKNDNHPEYAKEFSKSMKISHITQGIDSGLCDIISIFDIETHNINNALEEIKYMIKEGGYIIIFAINVVDDFDAMIEDIYHKLVKYNGKKKIYHNYLEYDFIMREHSFEWKFGLPIYNTFGLGAEYNSPMYAVYKYIVR